MSVGILEAGRTISAVAKGEGNPIFIVGSATGKDGIGGASFASAEITADSVEDLPAVQVGDPFQEKKLLEACLELMDTNAIVGMQDMGAAGIICSTAEMSAKGECGMYIDLDKVPTRQKNMKPWELLLSESQERMLICVKKGEEAAVLKVFEKWDLPCEEIGHVTSSGLLDFYSEGELVASLPAQLLVLGGGAPVYDRPFAEPSYLAKQADFKIEQIAIPENVKDIAEQIIQIPNIASKRWIYTQYDSMVGTGTTTTNEPCDAAITLIKGTKKGLVMSVDCNSRYVYANPQIGAMIAVSESARNIVCSGGQPLGVTNCLNFGNPYDPEVYWQFVQAIKGMGQACTKFDTPVTGGNVSFYNQGPEGAVYPTPTIGMVGLIADVTNKMTLDFKQAGDAILVIGAMQNDINSSEYLHKIHGVEFSPAPYFNIDEEYAVQQTIAALIGDKLIQSAHDISEGGLFVTLCESGFNRNLGFEIAADTDIRIDSFLFGEAQSRVVVTVKQHQLDAVLQVINTKQVAYSILGNVSNSNIEIAGINWGTISNWKNLYDTAIENYLK
jgi:phosphoribosylformylglycinamidine synthase subunit PurL